MKTNVEISKACCLCYGASRALDNTINACKTNKNVTLFKQLLHNKRTVKNLTELGVVQKDKLEDINKNDFVILRAHGEPKSTYEYLNKNKIKYLDCTCPNVLAINKLVETKSKQGFKIILVGKYGYKTHNMHPEVYGTAGWCKEPIFIEEIEETDNLDMSFDKYFLVVQTTFARDKALKIIENIQIKMRALNKEFEYRDTTCNAQRLINEESKILAKRVDYMIVVGGKNSSNTKELFNNVSNYTNAFFAESIDEVKEILRNNKIMLGSKIGLTGGASTTKEELFEIRDFILNWFKNKTI